MLTEATTIDPERLRALEARAATVAARKRRQKAARKSRDETKRMQASNYVSLQYGATQAPAIDVTCPLWSTKMDLKMAFMKTVSEVTHRCAVKAREPGSSRTRGTSARFGGAPFTVTVLDGTVAQTMSAAELSVDLLVLLHDGITEERLAALVTRWSKARARGSAAASSAMDDDL